VFGALALLPRGPHGLTRRQVAATQRARLLAAISDLVAEKGYGAVTITETARRAGVSPNVFYEHFRDKEQCFLAAYEVFIEWLLARMGAEVSPAADWHEFITATLNAYLGSLDAERDLARAFMIETNAAGPEVRRRRREAFAGFASLIKERHEQIRRRDPRLGPLPDRVYLGLAHGIRELACDSLEESPRQPLTDLAPDARRWITAMVEGAAAA
jgi:AcrR family transcriptional regulator